MSSLTLVTILIDLAALYARNASWSLPDEHKDIYPLFDDLMPGDFRKVMHLAQRETTAADRLVTVEGEHPHDLIFATKGTFRVQKGQVHFEVHGPTFIGEVTYLRGTPSAATTTLLPGTEVVV